MEHVERSSKLRAGLALLFLLVAACGGTGGDPRAGPPAPPPSQAPVPAPGPAPVPVPSPPPSPTAVQWGIFPSASQVIGQSSFEARVIDPDPAVSLNRPQGAVAVSPAGDLYVAESPNDVRLNIFSDYQNSIPGSAPDFSMSFTQPLYSASISGGKLFLPGYDSVLYYDAVPASLPTEIDNFVGNRSRACVARDLANAMSAQLTPDGRLVVVDNNNHRVLIFDRLPEWVGQEVIPSVVIGQTGLSSCEPGAGPSSLDRPTSAWTDGTRLIVADTGNHRVLIWDSLPSGVAAPAHHVIGQLTMAGDQPNAGQAFPSEYTLFSPASVDVSETGQLAVADTGNNRVLIWDRIPQANGQPANHVIGQPGFVSGDENAGGGVLAPGAKTLRGPTGVKFHGRKLIVTDTMNLRVLVWRALD